MLEVCEAYQGLTISNLTGAYALVIARRIAMATTEVSPMIRSTQDFCAQLKKGDQFWYVASKNFKPDIVRGPFVLVALFQKAGYKGARQFLNVRVRSGGNYYSRPKVDDFSVNDLTNQHHGVFLAEAEAHEYLRDRKRMFAENPEMALALSAEAREWGF